MFCSTNSGISLPQQLSPGFNLAAALDGFNDEETLLDHDCLDLLFHCLLETPTDKTMCSTKRMSISPEVYRSNGDRSHPLRKHRRRQSEKKDRHSKIFTAQGPRNRRLRLSMDVGRKFFDLQDLLGFDKASKTLDWLLRKSKTAIKELTQMKHVDDPRAKSLCSRSECENLDLQKSTASKKKQRRNPANPKEAKGPRRAYLNPSISDQPRTWSQIGSYSKASESNCYNRISSVNINTGLNGFFFFQPNLVWKCFMIIFFRVFSISTFRRLQSLSRSREN